MGEIREKAELASSRPKRERIQLVRTRRLQEPDESPWALYVAILLLAGLVGWWIIRHASFEFDPQNPLANGFVRLGVLMALVGILLGAVWLLQRRVLRRVQLCVILSLLFHLILGLFLAERYLAVAARLRSDQAAKVLPKTPPVTLPEYGVPIDITGERAPQPFERPLVSETPELAHEEVKPEDVPRAEVAVEVPSQVEVRSPQPRPPQPWDVARQTPPVPRLTQNHSGAKLTRQERVARFAPDPSVFVPEPPIAAVQPSDQSLRPPSLEVSRAQTSLPEARLARDTVASDAQPAQPTVFRSERVLPDLSRRDLPDQSRIPARERPARQASLPSLELTPVVPAIPKVAGAPSPTPWMRMPELELSQRSVDPVASIAEPATFSARQPNLPPAPQLLDTASARSGPSVRPLPIAAEVERPQTRRRFDARSVLERPQALSGPRADSAVARTVPSTPDATVKSVAAPSTAQSAGASASGNPQFDHALPRPEEAALAGLMSSGAGWPAGLTRIPAASTDQALPQAATPTISPTALEAVRAGSSAAESRTTRVGSISSGVERATSSLASARAGSRSRTLSELHAGSAVGAVADSLPPGQGNLARAGAGEGSAGDVGGGLVSTGPSLQLGSTAEAISPPAGTDLGEISGPQLLDTSTDFGSGQSPTIGAASATLVGRPGGLIPSPLERGEGSKSGRASAEGSQGHGAMPGSSETDLAMGMGSSGLADRPARRTFRARLGEDFPLGFDGDLATASAGRGSGPPGDASAATSQTASEPIAPGEIAAAVSAGQEAGASGEPGGMDGPEMLGSIRVPALAPAGPGGWGAGPSTSVAVAVPRGDRWSQIAHPYPRRGVGKLPGGLPALPGVLAELPTQAYEQRRPDTRAEVARRHGGSVSAEEAVERGLAFLARYQFPDGRWRLDSVPPGQSAFPEQDLIVIRADSAATGLALMAFLGAGYTHLEYKYQETVSKGLEWLIASQQPNGALFTEENDQHRGARIYGHGMATIALCEAYGMTRDPRLREPAERAVGFILEAQDPKYGGWRYTPRADQKEWIKESDTAVSGWQVMALKSAQLAGISIPQESFRRVSGWLDLAQHDGGAQYCYTPYGVPGPDNPDGGRSPNLAMTAEGLLMRIYLGWDRATPALQRGADHLAKNPPVINPKVLNSRDAYYWYYATQVLFYVQGPLWDRWNEKMRNVLEKSQVTEGPLAGSWSPDVPVRDRWAHAGGRIYVTAIHLLLLEVYYRHLPLFETLVADGRASP